MAEARVSLSMDGDWSFRHDSDGVARTAKVPGPWQAQFADLRAVSGRASYWRRFARPDVGAGQEVVLRFGAVSYLAVVSVNGVEVGRHEGGYLPFECAVPAGILEDWNTVEVRCLLPDGAGNDAGIAFAEIPHGKQSWYGPIGGIWQSVVLEVRSAIRLEHVAIAAEIGGRVGLRLVVTEGAVGGVAEVSVTGPEGVVQGSIALTGVESSGVVLVAGPQLWSPETPVLYRLRVAIWRGAVLDVTEHSFGFRTFEARDGQMFLNGAPFYMRAALDQDYYPEGICTPPSVAFLEDQFGKAKALGLNMLRCHIKVPDPRYYEVADRLGLLIWTEIPNVAVLTEASAGRLKATMEGILARDGNHPCIVIWTLINEDWGTRLCEDAAHRAWLKGMFDWLKGRDPTRLVVDNSPCNGNFHVKSDLDDFHYYRSVPERRAEWDQLTAEFAGGAAWTYSPFGDAVRTGAEPKIVSEFGVWGLPDPAAVELAGAEPWWMETGQGWGDGAAYPHGVQARFLGLGLGGVFGSFDAFIGQVQWYQFANLKYQIEVMRGWPQITGYVITEFTDVHWESNGLLDMNRNPRVFHDAFATINADVVIVPRVQRYAGVAGEGFAFGVAVAAGGKTVSGGVLRWEIEGASGEIAVPDVAALGVVDCGTVSLALPMAAGNRMVAIALTLFSGSAEIARNRVEVAVYTPRSATGLPSVGSDDAALAAYAEALGYDVVAVDHAEVVLTQGLTAGDIARLQGGARYLVLADGSAKTKGNLRVDERGREQPFMPVVDAMPGIPIGAEAVLPNIGLVARQGTMWRGDWIAGFSWIRRDGAFADMPGGPLLDMSFDKVVPHYVMTGFRGHEYAGAVQAGVVVGWVHKPAAFIAERRVGRGGLVACTFRLMTEPAGADPVAAYLFDALVKSAQGIKVDAGALG